MSIIIAGVDPSLSATGVIVSDPNNGPEAFNYRTFGSKAHEKTVRSRFGRFEDLVGRICDYLREQQATVIYLENYSFASKFNVTLLAEFGGILRWNLLDVGDVVEVAPSTLKKFVTGSGDGEKALVAAAIVRRWEVMLDSTDLFDAYAAWRLGRCCQNVDPCETDAQRESVAKVLGIEIPKVKKPRSKPIPKPF